MAGDEDGEVFPPSGVFGGISEGVFPASASIFFAFRAPFPAGSPLRESSGGIILLILYNTLLFVVA